MTDIAAAPGLREQKRLATKRALQLTLLQLSLDRGFDSVTVEEVAQAVGVSPRTFFNYFASKEEAIAPQHGPLEIPAEDRADYLAGDGDPLSDLVALIVARARGDEDLELHRLRRRLIERESRLVGDKVANVQRMHEQMLSLVTERLVLDAERAGGATDERAARDRAGLVVAVAIAVARHGWGGWAAEDAATSLGSRIERSLDDFVDLAREVLDARSR